MILLLLFFCCLPSPSASADLSCVTGECRLNQTKLRFIAIGDWGGLPFWPFVTYTQTNVAKGLSLVSKARGGLDFIASVGDNFYFGGVSSAADNRFQRTFEDVYHETKLPSPWYLIAGNHDHHGSIQAQIDYTRHSQRWTYPDYNYTVKYVLGDGTRIQLVMIDTVVLCGNTRLTAMNVMESSSPPKGAADPTKSESQWQWIEETLRRSTSDYLMVVGHYPIWSVAEHGPTDCMKNRLDPMLKTYKVSAYISGHDHNLQYFEVNDNNWTGRYPISGAGAYMHHSKGHNSKVPVDSLKFFYPPASWSNLLKLVGFGKGGFLYTELSKDAGKFHFHNGDGKLLSSFPITPRSN